MKKIDYNMPRPKFQTRPGTKPNRAGEKLVNVTDGTAVVRVRRSEAEKLVERGWKFCPKRVNK